MWWFNNGKKLETPNKEIINSREYDNLFKRFSEVYAELSLLKTDVKNFGTELDNLRGKFNRKLKGLEQEEKKVEEEQKTINTGEYIAFG